MDNLKYILMRLLKISPLLLILIITLSDIAMHLTSNYMNTPTKWDDIFYMIASYVSDAGKSVLQSCSIIGK